MKKCLVSGSFDPITKGHIDIIKKAADSMRRNAKCSSSRR